MLVDIPIDSLVPHPENSNYMPAGMLRKLRLHIERTGRYEPLTVRPHPTLEGRFELLNGHNRLRVLRAIGHQSARCVVWDVNDDQARLYLATLNRLAGSDVPERWAALVERKLKPLIGNRVLYPDGTVNSFVQRYLRERVLKLFDAKTARPTKSKST